MKHIIKHWQSTVAGLLIAVFTLLLYQKIITAQDWMLLMGGIATVIGLLAKDPDKTQSKS